jgi:hypothetical protein
MTAWAASLAQKLTETLGKQFIVDNRGGRERHDRQRARRQGAEGRLHAARERREFRNHPSLYAKATYDPIRQFEPISLVASRRTCSSCIRRCPRRR